MINRSEELILQEPDALQSPAPEKRVYTAGQKWLLAAATLIGIAFRLGWGEGPVACWSGWYGAFWLVAMALFSAFAWRHAIGSRTALAIGGAAFAMCVLQMAYGFGSSDNGAETSALYLYFLPAIPTAMLLYLVFSTCDVPVQREGVAVIGMLRGVFVEPFSAVPRFFGALGALLSSHARGAWKRVLLGVLLAVPVTAVVTLLLTRADANMERLLANVLVNVPLGQWLGDFAVVFMVAMLFYSLFYHAVWRESKPLAPRTAPGWPASTLGVIVLALLAVYAVFLCLQFSYLFGGTLPNALTYSEYARQGFMELNVVAAINFTLFGLCVRYAVPRRQLTVLCALLLGATGLLAASCIVRLLLYIGAYGLTMRRILPLWLALFFAALSVLGALRLRKPGLPLVRAAGLGFLYWYVALHIPNWGAIIAAYNAARGLG